VSELLYVYGVVPASQQAGGLAGLAGIGGASVGLVTEGPVAAVVSAVPAAEFDEEPLNSRLRDLEWLSPRAAAHQDVNAQLLERGEALLPLSFGTVYRDEGSLRRALRARADEFARRLEAVRDRAEWVVTLTRDQTRALAALERASEALRRLSDEIAASPPGRQYLLTRRLGDRRRQELANLDAEAIESAVLGLAGSAERLYREPLAEGMVGGPIARASLLVPRAREGALREEIGRLNERWAGRGYALARADLEAMAELLGDKPFFMGDRITTIDASAYGCLANILLIPLETELKRIAAGLPSLAAWCEAMEQGLKSEGDG
jgi:hypothetical protein